MKVAVLGSGIIGVATAWWLAQEGYEVVVIDRQPGPALETTRACGGIVSASYAEPWASPQMPSRLLRWLFKDNMPLLFKPSVDTKQWLWGLEFLKECAPNRFKHNLNAMAHLAEYSLDCLKQLRTQLSLNYKHHQHGIVRFYRDERSFSLSQDVSDRLRDMGIERRLLNVEELVALEPSLAAIRAQLIGGDYSTNDEVGDAHAFTVQLAQHAERSGVQFLYQHTITRLLFDQGLINAVELINPAGLYEQIEADCFVVALGAYSPHVVQPLGIRCPVYPAKGYSATFTLLNTAKAPKASIVDGQHHLLFSRLGHQLRVSGLAELTGYKRTLSPRRCQTILHHTKQLFGDALDFESVQYWAGLRPTTPSNVPLIGRTHVKNLYLNTGHGTLGWTMGVGSGRALADLIAGRRPQPEFPFLH